MDNGRCAAYIKRGSKTQFECDMSVMHDVAAASLQKMQSSQKTKTLISLAVKPLIPNK